MELNPHINFIKSKYQVSEEQISAFETQIGFKFPQDYRQFLKEYNGPKAQPRDMKLHEYDLLQPTIDLSSADIPNLDTFSVAWWMGFADPAADYRYGMIERYEVHHEDWKLSAGIVAIGGSSGPGCVYINLADDSRKNHILLIGDTVVDRQNEELEVTSEHFVSVASSFTEFIYKLYWS